MDPAQPPLLPGFSGLLPGLTTEWFSVPNRPDIGPVPGSTGQSGFH